MYVILWKLARTGYELEKHGDDNVVGHITEPAIRRLQSSYAEQL